MLQMKWNLDDQGRLYATWEKSYKLPNCWKSDQYMWDELRLINSLYAALDAVFTTNER